MSGSPGSAPNATPSARSRRRHQRSAARSGGRRWDAEGPAGKRALLKMALRGRKLTVGPADPANRANVTRRVTVTGPP